MADPRIRERGVQGAGGWLEQACKLILIVRAAALVITVLYLPRAGADSPVLLGALALAAAASAGPLLFWDRIGPALVRHPGYLAAELVLTSLILVLTGYDSPFFSYTLGTALLGGLLYGWPGAALFSPLLVGVYFWMLDIRAEVDTIPDGFQVDVGLPALYLVAGAAGAAARGLLDRQAAFERGLAEQERAAAAERERARLARDMHDSLAKTVHGIGFAALALARRIEKDPSAAVAGARQLAEDAKQAADEARNLIADLRTGEDEPSLPPGEALRAEASDWSSRSGVTISWVADPVDSLPPVAARELRWILKEALRNVDRHAPLATQVAVRLRVLGGRVVLSVSDDGPGFEVPDDLSTLQGGRHYGLVGMRERAQVAGGDLMVDSHPGEGCTISVWVPAASPETALAPPSPRPTAEPSRSVPGYTWQ